MNKELVTAKEIDGELWVRGSDYQRVVTNAERKYLDAVEVNTALQHGLNETERKLAIAREALKEIKAFQCGTPVLTYQGMEIIAAKTLKQIGE